jgi:hypothetical protein
MLYRVDFRAVIGAAPTRGFDGPNDRLRFLLVGIRTVRGMLRGVLAGAQQLTSIISGNERKDVVLPLKPSHSIEQSLELFRRKGRANTRQAARNFTARGGQSLALAAVIHLLIATR